MINLKIAGVLGFFLLIQTARAAVSEQEAALLGAELTPIGAERAGNDAGTIPEWKGGITEAEIPGGFKPGQHYINPFPDDKPLFVITAGNLDKYQQYLSPGQQALFQQYPSSFKMPVYISRRTARQPQRIYENASKAATNARLLDNGRGFSGAYDAYPFPIPDNGLEALWNHIVRYRGEYVIRQAYGAAVHRNGHYSLVLTRQEGLMNYNLPGGSLISSIMLFYIICRLLNHRRI